MAYYDTTIMAVKSFMVQLPGINVIKNIFLTLTLRKISGKSNVSMKALCLTLEWDTADASLTWEF
jgi:hypothetical protein